MLPQLVPHTDQQLFVLSATEELSGTYLTVKAMGNERFHSVQDLPTYVAWLATINYQDHVPSFVLWPDGQSGRRIIISPLVELTFVKDIRSALTSLVAYLPTFLNGGV